MFREFKEFREFRELSDGLNSLFILCFFAIKNPLGMTPLSCQSGAVVALT